MQTNKKESMVPKLQYKISHIRQSYRWDCGITCILMLLSEEKRKAFVENFSQICDEEGFGQSTWTIDLCYLLKRFNIKHCMYTTRQAPSMKSLKKLKKKYYSDSKFEFYSLEIKAGKGSRRDEDLYCNSSNVIPQEAERVKLRFATAKFHGLKVCDGLLSTRDLISHVLTVGPAIVLVNAALLSCDWCKRNKMASEFSRIFGGTYRGHYILVVGWSGKLLYLDPARPAPLCATAAARLHSARLVHATDCDVILLFDDYR